MSEWVSELSNEWLKKQPFERIRWCCMISAATWLVRINTFCVSKRCGDIWRLSFCLSVCESDCIAYDHRQWKLETHQQTNNLSWKPWRRREFQNWGIKFSCALIIIGTSPVEKSDENSHFFSNSSSEAASALLALSRSSLSCSSSRIWWLSLSFRSLSSSSSRSKFSSWKLTGKSHQPSSWNPENRGGLSWKKSSCDMKRMNKEVTI